MCYKVSRVSFNRICPNCRSSQCSGSVYCTECGAEMPLVVKPGSDPYAPPPKRPQTPMAPKAKHEANTHKAKTPKA